MIIIPYVKSLQKNSGIFKLSASSSIHAPADLTKNPFIIEFLISNIEKYLGLKLPVRSDKSPQTCIILKTAKQSNANESYTIYITETCIEISAASDCALYRGVTSVIQLLKLNGTQIPCCQISDSPDFKFRGLLHDTTRGKVPTLDTLKEIALQCAFYKINQLQLYVEHSFAFSKIPEFSVGSDPLTSDEIRELDEFCKLHYIGLVPALATFGHLYELLRIKRFSHLNELDIDASTLPHNLWDRMAHYTLYPESEEGFLLIKSMIEEIIPLFSSPFFNICADETFDLGLGKSKNRAEKSGVGIVYAEFVNKILQVIIAHGKTPMMWGDIILNHPEILPSFPEKTIFLNWGYGADVNSDSTEKFAKEEVPFYVCPGVIGWSRFANNINDASINIKKMVAYGKQYDADGVLNTNRGDCGNVNFFSSSLHGIALGAALSWNASNHIDDKQFDKDFSIVQWGVPYEKIGTLLRDLGSCTWYHFGNVYGWIKNLNCLWNKENDVEKIDMEKLVDSCKTARSIRLEFEKLLTGATTEEIDDLEEFRWSSSAVLWICELLIFKKTAQFGQESSLLVDKNNLMNSTNELIIEFKRLWRRKSKESELRNIVELFIEVSNKVYCM